MIHIQKVTFLVRVLAKNERSLISREEKLQQQFSKREEDSTERNTQAF